MARRCCNQKPLFTLFLTLNENEKEEYALCQDHLNMIKKDYEKQFEQYEEKLTAYNKQITFYEMKIAEYKNRLQNYKGKLIDISLNIQEETKPKIKLDLSG